MNQTDKASTNSNKSGFPTQNGQHDEFLTQSSDIPMYDVLGRKYFASPDKLEFFRQSFSLPDLKTFRKSSVNGNFDPVIKKEVTTQGANKFFFIHDESVKQVDEPISEKSNVEVSVTTSKSQSVKFDILEGKEVPPVDGIVHSVFPAVEKTGNPAETISVDHFINRRPRIEQSQFSNVDWATGLFILLLIVLAYTRIAFGRFFQPIIQSAFIYNLSVRIYSEKSLVLNRLSSILNYMFVLTLAAFLTLWFDYYGFSLFNLDVWQHFFVFLGMLIVLFFARKFIHVLLGSIFGIGDILSEYSFHGNLFLKVAGLLILPIVIVLPYIPDYQPERLFVVTALLLVIIYLFRILRTFSITIRKGFSIFYLILYLCALEIGPCLVFFKILKESM